MKKKWDIFSSKKEFTLFTVWLFNIKGLLDSAYISRSAEPNPQFYQTYPVTRYFNTISKCIEASHVLIRHTKIHPSLQISTSLKYTENYSCESKEGKLTDFYKTVDYPTTLMKIWRR